MKSKPQEHGSARYDYASGKIHTGGQKAKSETPMKEIPMGRRVMPGDSHAAMKSGKC